MRILYKLFILSAIFILQSCYTRYTNNLLQERKNLPQYDKVDVKKYRLKVNDELVIRVLSTNESITKIFSPSSMGQSAYRIFEDGTVEIPDSGIEEINLTGWEYYGRYALSKRNFHFVCVVLRIYRKEFLLADGLFFEEGIYHEDNLFTPIVCYYAASVRGIPDILYVYRIRQGSITQSFTDKRIFDTIKVANRLAEFFIPKTDIDKSVVYREIAGEYFSVFMSDKAEAYRGDYSVVEPLINWDSYKAVSLYPRHRRIYRLLSISPRLFRLYLGVEKLLKR